MSRITEMILDPQVTYTGKTFTVRVKVQDDYKYKKYLISENIKYVTATGESFTLTNVNGTQPGSILEITGKSIQNGTPTPDAPVEIQSVSGDNHINVNGKNNFDGIFELGTINASGQNSTSSSIIRTKNYTGIKPNAPYTLKNPSQVTEIALYYYKDNTYVGTSSPGLKEDKSVTFTTRTDANQMRWRYNTGYTTTENEVMLLEGTIAMADIPEYEPYEGNKYRIDLGGTNLINPNRNSYTTEGVTLTNNGDGTYTANGTTTATVSLILSSNPQNYIKMETGKSYTYMVKEISGTGQGTFPMAVLKDDDTTQYNFFALRPNDSTYSITKTMTENLRPKEICLYATSGKTFDNYRFAVELAEAPGEIEYSPYVENPIELCGIDGYENIIRKSTGKNLYDKSKETNQIISGGVISNDVAWRLSDYIEVEEGKKYTVAWNGDNNYFQARVSYFDENKTYKSEQNFNNYPTNPKTNTFTTPEGTKFIRFNYAILINNVTVIREAIQIEKGETPTDPEPFGVGIWFISIGTRRTKLAIADMNNSNTYPGWKDVPHLRGDVGGNINSDINSTWITTKWKSNIVTPNATGRKIGINTNSTNSTLFLYSNTFGKTQTQWIENYPNLIFELEYALSRNDIIEITNEDLIDQLNAIQNMQTQDGETNIFWTGDVAPEMKIQYANKEELHANIITENGKKIRTDWRSLERRNKWMTK